MLEMWTPPRNRRSGSVLLRLFLLLTAALAALAAAGCGPKHWTEAGREEAIGPPSPDWARGSYLAPNQDWYQESEKLPEEVLAEFEAVAADVPPAGESYEQAARQVLENARRSGQLSDGATAGDYGGTSSISREKPPWWASRITRPIDQGANTITADMESLFLGALSNSDQIKVYSDLPLIRETGILEAEGRFDPRLFLEGELSSIDEPTGSTLKTGGPERFEENEWTVTGGVRKRFSSGADIELSQRVGELENNSVFLVPQDQALTKLNLSITQPLLRGGGYEYNRSTIRIAKLDHEVAMAEFQRQVESHLLEVSRAYWALYRNRGELLIKTRLLDETESLVEELVARKEIDATDSQILRAKSASAARRAETIRAGLGVRNAEASLAALVNSPLLRLGQGVEVVPTSRPVLQPRSMGSSEAAQHALRNRPEIKQAMRQIKAGILRQEISENELLPQLDAVVGVTWHGLEGDYDLGGAMGSQFDEGSPSLYGGLALNVPLGNREAKARYQRRRIEVRQLTNQLRTTMNTLLLEVQVSVREADIAYREMIAKDQSVLASQADLASKRELHIHGTGTGVESSLRLDQLLDAQLRLALAESELLASVANYNVALVNLDRAMGVLLQARGIGPRQDLGPYQTPRLEMLSQQGAAAGAVSSGSVP
jgi:outer membrane protein TolC